MLTEELAISNARHVAASLTKRLGVEITTADVIQAGYILLASKLDWAVEGTRATQLLIDLMQKQERDFLESWSVNDVDSAFHNQPRPIIG